MAPSRTSTSKKASAKAAKDGKTTKKAKGTRSYKSYIHALLKAQGKKAKVTRQITSKGMAIVNSFATDLFERLAGEASRLSTYSGAKTLSSKAVVAAVKLQLPKGMAAPALAAGAKAVGAYAKKSQ